MLEEPRRGDDLHEGILQLVEPDKSGPQRVVGRAVLAHADPLHRDGDGHGHRTHAHEHEAGEEPGEGEAEGVEKRVVDAKGCREQHGRKHRCQKAHGFHHTAGGLDGKARVIGQRLARVGGGVHLYGHAAHALWRCTPPVGAGLCLLRGRRKHGNQRVLG